MLARFPVPWTNLLTDVAAKYEIVDLWTQLFGDLCLVLNGQIRDAQICIERTVWQDGLGGASVDAARAGAAMVACKGRVCGEFDAEQYLGKEKVGAFFGADETGVFADPAKPCALGHVPFKDGAGVCIPPIGNRGADLVFDKGDDILEFFFEKKMVVVG